MQNKIIFSLIFLIGIFLLPLISAANETNATFNISNINMEQVKGTAVTLWDYFKIALDWSRGMIMKLAGFIGKYIGFPVENIYLVLLILISMLVVGKIFYTQNTTIRGRGLSFFLYVLILFFALRYL